MERSEYPVNGRTDSHVNGQSNGSTVGVMDRIKHETDFFSWDLRAIRSDLQDLAAKELELFNAEIQESVGHARRGLMFGGIAAVMATLLLAFAFVSLMFGLAEFMETWAAALITTGVIAAFAATFGLVARQQFKAFSLTPKRTINSVKEDAEWARSLLKSSKK